MGVSIVPVGLLGHRSFLIQASRHEHNQEIFVPSIFACLYPFLLFSFFEASILVLRVLVLIPVNDSLAKTEVEITHAFLMGKAG